jgi:hypothetical protein
MVGNNTIIYCVAVVEVNICCWSPIRVLVFLYAFDRTLVVNVKTCDTYEVIWSGY